MFVLDTSVTMNWCFAEETNTYAESVLDRLQESGARVPAIWSLEVANVLLVGVRRGRLTDAQVTHFLTLLTALPIAIDVGALSEALRGVLDLGRRLGISAHDATYLELAARTGLPLATQDGRLRDAAIRLGVDLVP